MFITAGPSTKLLAWGGGKGGILEDMCYERRRAGGSRVALLPRDIQQRLSQWRGVPLFTIWDPVASPGRTPMLGNNSGPSLGNIAVPSTHGRPPGRREILVPDRSPFGAEHAGLAP